ncbi:MAG: protein kinase [Polyangiaceae bacterium]|nr:protein kinase [Polyangiaceae bacterium]
MTAPQPSPSGTGGGAGLARNERDAAASAPSAEAPVPSPSPAFPEIGPGTVIDRRYRLHRLIARGGGGTVYEAEHIVFGRRVALKIITPRDAGWVQKRARLAREARALAMAQQPNVVEVLDAGVDSAGIPYLAMELLEGRGLDGILASKRCLDEADAIGLGVELGRALGHAHHRGLLHRDVKPSNVFIARSAIGEEQVKLIDFGIARMRDEGPTDVRITRVGEIVGTPEYFSPEQMLAPETCDHRTDVYSLGVLLFECVTGAVPFEGSFGEIVLRVNTEPTPTVRSRNPAVSAELDAIVQRALARNPADRFADMSAMAAALGALAAPGPRRPILVGRPPGSTESPPRAPVAAPDDAPFAAQRRQFPRVPYITPIQLMLRDGTVIDGRTEDIGEGGVLVILPRPFDAELLAQVRLAMPVTGRIATVQARTRWLRIARTGTAAGIEFVDPTPELGAAVRSCVDLARGE